MARVTQAHADARVQDILRAGAKVFAERGSTGATMAQIAREAGLSAGTLYLYFSNKTDLLRAVCSMKHEDVGRVLAPDVRGDETPMQSFDRIVLQLGEVYADPDIREQSICSLESVLLAARDPDGFGREQRLIDAEVNANLADLLGAAQAAGELDPTIRVHDLAVVLHAFAQGLRELRLNSPDVVDPRRAFALIGRMLHGLAETQEGEGNRQPASNVPMPLAADR